MSLEPKASFDAKLSLESRRSLLDAPVYLDSFCLAYTSFKACIKPCKIHCRSSCCTIECICIQTLVGQHMQCAEVRCKHPKTRV